MLRNQLVLGFQLKGASEESGEWEELKSCRRSLEAKHSDHFHSLCCVGGQLLGCWVPDKSWQGSMVTNWMSTKNRDLFEDQTMNQCRFNVKVHRYVFCHNWPRCKQSSRHLTTFEPEMPKVCDWVVLIGLFQFCTCFSPRVFFACFWLGYESTKSCISKLKGLCWSDSGPDP